MKENNCIISVIVPVYNAAGFIEETITTVQAQSFNEWELLLVDDCSSDNSCEIIERYMALDSRIQLIRQEKNSGAAAARNTGILKAKGRYICFLDADDLWERDKLSSEFVFMREQKAFFAFTGYEFADEQGRGLGKVVHVPEAITYRQALKNTTIFTSTVMIDTSKVDKKDICMPLVESEDTAAWWHILKKYGPGCGLDKTLVKYRRSGGTLSSNKVRAVRRIWNLYRKQEGLSLIRSIYCMCFWAFRAVLRRL